MNAFEKWQVVIFVSQTLILFGTLLVALYIGLKQNEINLKQTEISLKQVEISKNLAELPYMISVEVTYDSINKRINIYNKGQTNIYLWGNQLEHHSADIEKEPRLVTPQGSYYLLADIFDQELVKAVQKNGEAKIGFKIYLSNINETRYTVSNIIFAKMENQQMMVHMQTTSIKAIGW